MLPETLREAVRRFGDATAYVAPDGWALSYRELDHASDEVAVGLARRGIGTGSVAALVLPPGPDFV
ncbi:MAG TPA: AMP-binding protein, partial [Acidimicrobiia bacterium]|nr:AMP-binding protein [Acidimicrobiia bacterium]